MASVTRTIAQFFDETGAMVATLSITFDNVTKAVTQVSWTVAKGTLTLTVHRQGSADIVIQKTADGQQNVTGQGMTLDTLNQSQFDVNWSS